MSKLTEALVVVDTGSRDADTLALITELQSRKDAAQQAAEAHAKQSEADLLAMLEGETVASPDAVDKARKKKEKRKRQLATKAQQAEALSSELEPEPEPELQPDDDRLPDYLQSIGYTKHLPTLTDAGVSLEDLLSSSEPDLQALDIAKGPRVKILGPILTDCMR